MFFTFYFFSAPNVISLLIIYISRFNAPKRIQILNRNIYGLELNKTKTCLK
jgi:hypothetical protein